MYRPFLFVGLGGSGGKTLRFLKKGTQRWLNQNGWEGEGVPEGWQFLHIDTPTIPDGKELNRYVDQLESSEYVGLVGDGIDYLAVANALDNIQGMEEELLGWRIDPVALTVPIGTGAGQFRAIGRTVAMLQGPKIRDRLKASFDRIKAPAARAELGQLFSLVTGRTPDQDYPSPVVVIVSSLAGGTGAGLLMNVCDLIQELGESNATLTLLYTPEVFASTPGQGGALNANSLAAISEVLNGHWLHGSVDGGGREGAIEPRSGQDLKFAGAGQSVSRSGPEYPFLIGNKNASGAAFGTDRALFEMVGDALVSWLTDIGVQSSLIAYCTSNWEGKARENNPAPDVLVNRGTNEELGTPAFSALGVASLTLGLEQFERYAAERIALDAATWLSRAHTDSDAALRIIEGQALRAPSAVSAAIAEMELEVFLIRARLAERGPDDMVINEMRPDDDDLRREAYGQASILAEIGVGGTTSGQAWAERMVIPAVETSLRTYGESYSDRLQERARLWVESSPAVIIEAVDSVVAAFGARVAAAVVRLAAQHILADDGVAAELVDEARKIHERAGDVARQHVVYGTLQGLGNKVDNRHSAIEQAVSEALSYGFYIGEAQLRETAASMLRSLAQGFLKPLARELDSSADLLDQDLQTDAANWAPWVPGMPPAHLLPPLSEVTLIEPARFSDHFEELLSESYPRLSSHEQRLALRREVTTGGFLRNDSENSTASTRQTAIHVAERWWPGNSVVRDVLKSESSAAFSVQISPTDLYERARAWMRRPNSPFSDFLGESLRTYLQRDQMFSGASKAEAVYVQRRREFIPKLQAAIAASAPLVSLDASLMGTLHPGMAQKPFEPIMSSLPFKNHALEAAVTDVLAAQLDGDVQKASDLMTTDQLTRSIRIASTLKKPCSPLVIESLMRPIASSWAAVSQSPGQAQHFWLRRRARPLQEFIPAPQEHILCMTRGWFIGVSLGVIERSTPARIGRGGDKPALFPKVYLSRSGDARDVLPQVLESLSLAFVEVSNSGTLRPLDAYIALRDLGRCSLEDEQLVEFPNLGYALRKWSQSGSIDGALGSALVTADTETGRLEGLLELFRNAQQGYLEERSRLSDVWRRQRSKLGSPPLWPGIEWHIRTALGQLVAVLEAEIDAGGRGRSVLM